MGIDDANDDDDVATTANQRKKKSDKGIIDEIRFRVVIGSQLLLPKIRKNKCVQVTRPAVGNFLSIQRNSQGKLNYQTHNVLQKQTEQSIREFLKQEWRRADVVEHHQFPLDLPFATIRVQTATMLLLL